MSAPFDLVIVGGGMVGACAAALAAGGHPDWRVLLLERSLVGFGSSVHSAGLATPLAGRAGFSLVKRSAALFDEWRRVLPDLPLRTLPVFFLCPRSERAELSRQLNEPCPAAVGESLWTEVGIPWPRLVDADEEFVGPVRAQAGDVAAIVRRLLRVASEGARFVCWEGAEASTYLRQQDGLLGLQTADGRQVETVRLLFAPGPWVLHSPVGGWAGSHGIRIKKVVALLLDFPSTPASPVVYLAHREAFLLPMPAQHAWLFSFRCEEWDCQPDVGSLRITTADRQAGLAILGSVFPSLAERCTGGRVFCDAYTPDGTPLVAPVEDAAPVVVVTGASGSGYKLGPVLAEEALRLLS